MNSVDSAPSGAVPKYRLCNGSIELEGVDMYLQPSEHCEARGGCGDGECWPC
jgi:hypothetical protein